jgi:hypothetical protein
MVHQDSEVQYAARKSPDQRQGESEARKAFETPAKVIKRRLVKVVRSLEWIQQGDVRRHSGGCRRVVPIPEGLHQRLGLPHQNDKGRFVQRHLLSLRCCNEGSYR